MLTIVCWYWKGKKPIFDERHVHGLARQCRDKIKRPHRFVCITDQPGVECETFPLWEFPEVRVTVRRSLDCWRRLRIFDPEIGRQIGDRILSVDLCVLLRDDITERIDESLDFQAMQGSVSPLAGGLFTLKTGTNAHVWESFDPETSALRIEDTKHNGRALRGSDQAWLSIQMPDAHVWTREDGVWKFPELLELGYVPENTRFIAFPKWKPWNAKVRDGFPELYDEYMSYLEAA